MYVTLQTPSPYPLPPPPLDNPTFLTHYTHITIYEPPRQVSPPSNPSSTPSPSRTKSLIYSPKPCVCLYMYIGIYRCMHV